MWHSPLSPIRLHTSARLLSYLFSKLRPDLIVVSLHCWAAHIQLPGNLRLVGHAWILPQIGGNHATVHQLLHILAHRIFAHPCCTADVLIAGSALVCFLVFASAEVAVHRQFPRAQPQDENVIGQREKVSLVLHLPPPVRSITHWMNCSLGTTMRFPIRSIGKSGSCMSS